MTSARRTASTTSRAAVDNSRLAAFGARCRRYVTASYSYRWLTAEPDPEVIVIDLRETRTIGPLVRLLDATTDALVPIWRASRTNALTDDVAATVRAAPLRVGGGVLAAAVLSNILIAFATRSLSAAGAMGHFVLLAAAILGVRSTATLDELRATRTAQFLIAAFEPPESPERTNSSDEEQSTDSTQ